ncbi:hypothetical protein DOK67_0001203 [Enterococcus sp. DIV0212c]|uniref:LPXTG cell wall anchor domain-containing protein n=1 Tax=Enterococcus sp. DIV0212c TaxID=2230867 RepID=UPI001A9ACF3B|nr:LPXTG cell wall anchor domain-containing protein [Enterococcus sp. DIV0212c]MBO1353674.1 LPXTG cell wall anchor domain-containing protein [Enterococcus sp. DIV0212c]
MKNKKIKLLLLFVVILCSVFGNGPSAQAVEGGDGQVNRGGKIIFYEETTESSTPIKDSSESSPDEPKVVKPKGRFPQTGELIQKYGWIILVLMIIGLFFFFLRKYRREAQ